MYVKFLKAKTDREAFYIGISGLDIDKHLVSEGYGLVLLEKGSAKTIFTDISLWDKGLGAIITCQSGPEK